ncbi:DUF5615 family PIN-like protein [Hoeflea sp. CAU 1731]
MKFLIDECLSIALVELAIEAGHVESAHVTRRGMQGWKDHQLMHAIIDDDWTLVTRNSDDFRPRVGSASQTPCYVGQPLHAARGSSLSQPANRLRQRWSNSVLSNGTGIYRKSR